MQTRSVAVLPYDASWETDFENIRKEIEVALKGLICRIEHVGSTAVKGLSAKPIIDIDVVIKDYTVFDDVKEKLHDIGYDHKGNQGIEEREVFKYTDKPHLKHHHLYVCPQNSKELHRHTVFRDYLRNHPEAVKQYSEVKERAAQLFSDDIEQYIIYKSPCIEELYRKCGLL